MTYGTLKAEQKQKILSIGVLTSEVLLLLLDPLMLIPVSSNVKIVGDRDTQLSHAEFKSPNVSNAMDPINWKTIVNSDGVVKQMKNWTLPDSKQRKGNCVPIRSSARTVGETIKPIPSNILSGNIVSTENGNKRNMSRSVKTGSSQFIL